MPRRSAIAETPVEIWNEIIHQVLHDLVLFRTDPFYPGCNPHSAIREWYHDHPARIKTYQNQRSILRLVSRSWKELVDSRFEWFLEHFTSNRPPSSNNPLVTGQSKALIKSPWKLSRRIYIDVGPPHACSQRCGLGILCSATRYIAADAKRYRKVSSDFKYLVLELAEGKPLLAEIIVLQAETWFTICNALHQDDISHLFSNVGAMEIASGVRNSIKVPDFLRKLTCLSILTSQNFKKERTRFPHLATLRIRLELHNFESFQNGIYPDYNI